MAERFLEEVIPQLPEFPAFKCNVENSTEITEKYQVTSAPSFKLFVNGEVVQTLFGMRSPDDLYYTIKNYVKEEENYADVWASLLDGSDEA
ncbi:thioredoxin family protein [Vulcanibacillus modesticaldus]|uniref:thioredoxin family protein n=1 Tax=Vulcanibacillus modesticaldus TaxID=337097 RepID=UPI0009FE220C